MSALDETHRADRRSWVADANGHPDFPIQNLPLGIISPTGGGGARPAVAIGSHVLDLAACAREGLLPSESAAALVGAETLNEVLRLDSRNRLALRHAIAALLDADAPARPHLLLAATDCAATLPVRIGDYTDFYAGIQHALNVGRLLRPDNPLLPNYKYVPIGYHGRASTVSVSDTPVRRPNGQRKPATEPVPTFRPSRNLDFELELGIWIGPGNALGEPIPIADAWDHIAGFCLLNDWSARDVQGWEYQPLGPFLAKSFVTTISPWIVTPEALAPFRTAPAPRPADDPAPLPYLADPEDARTGALDIALHATLLTQQMRAAGAAPVALTRSNARDLYWTPAQFVAHHASNGCALNPGDLFGSGTISGAEPGAWGSLLEITYGGRQPLELPGGETRRFLEDGDTIELSARCARDGFATIGFGPCRGTVLPAVPA